MKLSIRVPLPPVSKSSPVSIAPKLTIGYVERDIYDRSHQDPGNPLPYHIVPECKRFSLPSWKKYAHPPCFDYSRLDFSSCAFGSTYFTNRIELFRPNAEYYMLPPVIRLSPSQVGLAPSMPYYRYPPECINWSIARRMPVDKPWCPSINGIGWLLLEHFGMAYGIEIDCHNHNMTYWHYWIDTYLPYGWAAIAWDYVADASG